MYEHEYRPLLLILFIELSLFALLWKTFFWRRVLIFFKEKRVKKREKIISTFLIKSLKDMQNFDVKNAPKACHYRKELLASLESFNLRIQEKSWHDLKEALVREFLLKKARRFSKSVFWERRAFAARCLALLPLEEDIGILLSLIEDAKILVQSRAALGLIALESVDGIRKIIEHMADNRGFTHYIFEDALQNSTQKVIGIVIELAADPKLHFSCLTILKRQSIGFRFPDLDKDLNSDDLQTKLVAIHLLSKNPTKETEGKLISFSKSSEWRIRREAAIGLGLLGGQEGIRRLKEMLAEEKSIQVSVEVARSLHSLGQLESMKNEVNGQVIDYVVQFG